MPRSLGLVAVVCAACGGGGGEPDATAPIDANDAGPWPCEPRPPALLEPSTVTPTVVFDIELPLLPEADGAVDTFVDGDQIVVVTSRHLHFVSLDGVLNRSVLLELSAFGDGPTILRDVAKNGTGFGALVLSLADGNLRFCQLDPVTGADESRCMQVASGGIMFDGKVVTDGIGYAIYAHEYLGGAYAMRRWRFDDAGALLETEELWRDMPGSRYLIEAGAGAAGVLLVTAYGGRELYAHHLVGADHTFDSVRPPTLDYAGMGLVLREWTGDSSEALGYLTHMQCAGVDDEDYSQRMAVLTRFDLAEGTEAAVPLSLPFLVGAAVMFDGDETVVVYRWDFYDIRLARLAASGAAEVSELRLPLPQDGERFEIQSVAAGRAIAPGDYVFVYGGTGEFHHRRLARVTIP
jgi:hypothetical protein